MKDFWSSFAEWAKEKTSSPLYFTYIFYLIIWNWKIFHILFFENSSLFNAPRIEYVSSFLEFHIRISNYPWRNVILEWTTNTAWHILPPAILTYLSIKYLPKLYYWAYSIHLKNYYDRRELYERVNFEHEKFKTTQLRDIATQKVQQKKETEKIERIQTKEEKWRDELESMESNGSLRSAMKMTSEAVYGKDGNFTTNSGYTNGAVSYIDSKSLSFVDALGLVEIDMERGKIVFTEKGKFFLKELQLKHLL